MKTTYIVLMVVTGMIIPVMASLNAALALHLKNVSVAVVIFFAVALVFALTISLYFEGAKTLQTSIEIAKIPYFYFLGGLGVFLYITSISTIGPKIGIGNSVACVLLGQLITMTVIDHFALLGMPRASISIERIAGMVLMLAGLYFVLSSTPTKG